jgi:hypothetical protein
LHHVTISFASIAASLWFGFFALSTLPAQTISWTNGAGDNAWETPANWNPAVVPDSSSVTAQLSIAAPNNLSSNRTVGNLSLSSGARLNIVAGHWLLLTAPEGADATLPVLANDGAILVNTGEEDNSTFLGFGGGGSIEGTGEIILRGDLPGAFIDDATVSVFDGALTHGAGHTIAGRGTIAVQYAALLVNNGTIQADQNGRRLELDIGLGTTINNATMAAINGAILVVPSGLIDQSGGGNLQASGFGSVVQLGRPNGSSPRISGGRLSTSDGGLISIYAATLDGCTNSGQMEILVDGYQNPDVEISGGGLTNNGTIVVNPNSVGAVGVGFKIVGIGTLDGTGSVQFNGNPVGSNIVSSSGGTLHHGSDHLIHGTGDMSFFPNGALINDGTIRADQPGRAISISSGATHKNNGVIEAVNGGNIGVNGSLDQTGGGTIVARGAGSQATVESDQNHEITGGILRSENGATLRLVDTKLRRVSLSGEMLLVHANTSLDSAFDGTINLFDVGSGLSVSSGNLDGSVLIRLNGGYLRFTTSSRNYRSQTIEGSGTISTSSVGSFTNYGTISPGSPVGRIDLLANVNFGPSSVVIIQIASPSTSDQLRAVGSPPTPLKLDGTLQVDLLSGYVPAASNNFIVISTQTPLTGAFQNVPSGGRLNTVSGTGSFQVDYSGNNVVLSNYGGPLPVPLLVVTSITQDARHRFVLRGNGTPNTAFTIQATADPNTEFMPTGAAITDGNGAFTWTDNTLAEPPPRRFYRAKYP